MTGGASALRTADLGIISTMLSQAAQKAINCVLAKISYPILQDRLLGLNRKTDMSVESTSELDRKPECFAIQEGARWLREWCHQAQAGPGSDDDSLALAVSRVLLASRSADEAAAELFDLLGDGSFDAIQQVLEHRWGTPTDRHAKLHVTCAQLTQGTTCQRSVCMACCSNVVLHKLTSIA